VGAAGAPALKASAVGDEVSEIELAPVSGCKILVDGTFSVPSPASRVPRGSGAARLRLCAGPAPERIETPGTGPRHPHVQPDEAEERGQLSPVQDRPKAPRRVPEEVGHRHLAGEDEGHAPREKSNEQKGPAE